MPSGSSWSNTNGFNLIKHDYSLIDQDIKEYLSQKKEILDLQTTKEKEQRLNKRSFHKYFSNFLKKTKFPFSISFNFGFLIDEKKSNTLYLCIVNGKRNSTNIEIIGSEDEIFNYKLNFIIKTPIYVFNDCNIKKMFNTFSASKLLEIIPLSKNTFKDFAKLSLLLDFYENDCLPIYRLLSIRNLIIMIRRWRELLDIFIYLFLIKLMKNNIASLYT